MRLAKKTSYLLLLALILALALSLGPATVHAQGPGPGDKIIFGGSFILQNGHSLDGDLVVLGGTAHIEENASVNGDVAVIGGTATIDGFVAGDAVALGGVLHLGPHAIIEGDASAIGGIIEREPGAEVQGNIVETQERERGRIQITPEPGFQFWNQSFQWETPAPRPISWLKRAFLQGMAAIAWTAILAGLGIFLILLAPKPTERVAQTIKANPLLAFAVGFGASLLAGIVALLLGLTICLLPLSLAIGLAMLTALLFGWLALGWLLGRELMKGLNTENDSPIWEVVVGVAILTLMWKLPTIFPCVGGIASFLVMFVAGNIAIGSVMLTRFGTRSYPPTANKRPSIPPAPESILPERSEIPQEPPETPSEPHIPPSD